MTRAAVSQAKMERMARAIIGAGLPFRGFRTLPDGSVEALVGEPTAEVSRPVNDDDELDAELDAWRASHGDG